MQPMPKLRRTKGERRSGGSSNVSGMPPMPPMPGKGDVDRPGGDEAAIYGGGIRAMRSNLQREYGFGPMKDIEPEIERGVRNYITPMSTINVTKSSRDVRDVRYGYKRRGM